MMAIAISTPGGPEVLQPVRFPIPQVGPTDVLIRVAAAGVNGPDLAQRRGHYAPPPDASPLPGLEVSGHVSAIGSGVTGWSVGDAVVALTNGGGYAEYVAVPQGQILSLPAHWNLIDAAALPETWFTITQTLVMRAGLESGMTVLVHGAAGGIGGAAIQIAGILGAKSIAVVSSPEKAAYVSALGAAATIDRTREDILERVMALTDGRGVDRVIDIAGGQTAAINIAASARFGHILQISTLADRNATLSLGAIMANQLTLSGSTLRPQTAATKAAIAARILAELWPSAGAPAFVHPTIRRFPLSAAADAHRALEHPGAFGKIVMVTDDGATLKT